MVGLTEQWFLRRENNRWFEWNTDYKYHSKDAHFMEDKMWLELWGAQRIMGEAVFRLRAVGLFPPLIV